MIELMFGSIKDFINEALKTVKKVENKK